MLRLLVFTGLLVCSLAFPRQLPNLPAPIFPRTGRIVGGSEVSISTVPHQVTYLYRGSYICGGSIIREDWVISAAHCVFSNNAQDSSFRAGSDFYNSGGQVIGARKVIEHRTDDIALFELASSFALGENVNAIALPAKGTVLPNLTPASASGWGAISEGGSVSVRIRYVELPIVGFQECYDAYAKAGYRIQESEVCAGLLGQGGKDACQGDSGGPLVANNQLVGVTSWGVGCARPDYPGVWAGTAAVRDWIDETMG